MEVVPNIKCVIIGSKLVGKTSMLNSYVTSPQSATAPFDSYNGIKVQIEEEGEIFQIELWDTNSADHQKIIRKIYYENCSMIIVCYSVMDHEAFKEVKRKWIPEAKKCCPLTPFFLIGTKSDLRQDKVSLLRLDRLQNLKPISIDDGRKLAKKTSAAKYLECSAVNGDGLKEVFREVIRVYKNPPQMKESSCCIL